MIQDITVGQYIYGESVVHKMEAWVKIVLTVVYACVVFALRTPMGYVIYALFTAAVIVASGVPVKMLIKGLKPLIWLYAFTTFFNLFFTQGEPVFSLAMFWLEISITREGITASVLLAMRLTLFIMGTSLLTLTTAPLTLTDGIEKLLSPLKKIGVPSEDIAMMMSIALRFIPTIGEEAQRITKAQKSRGADMESGGIFKRAKAMIPVIVPLMTGAFRRADELAVAMDSRCYGMGKRTRMNVTKAGKRDAEAAVIFALVSAAAAAVDIILG